MGSSTYTVGRADLVDKNRILRVAGDATWRSYVERAQAELQLLPPKPAVSRKREQLYTIERAAYGEPGPKADTNWLLKAHGSPDFRRVTIYPEQFEKLMEQGVHNRQKKQRKIDLFSRLMILRRWVFNVGMTSDQEGMFQDGQNRALASMASDTPIDILYVVGMPVRNFVYLDQGTPRSGKDTMDTILPGEKNNRQLSTALRMGLQYESWGANTHLYWNRFLVSNDELADALSRYGDPIRKGVLAGQRVRDQIVGVSVGAVAVAYHRLSEVAPEHVVKGFFDAFAQGGAAATSPINVLRNVFIKQVETDIYGRLRRVPQGSRSNDMYGQLGCFINAWNLTMQGVKPRKQDVKFDGSKDFPLPMPFDIKEVGLHAV